MRSIDDATSSFLRVAADDLQRQLGVAGVVRDIGLEDAGTPGTAVTLVATVLVGRRTFEARGSGDSLVAAYADLRLCVPESTLAVAFTELVEP